MEHGLVLVVTILKVLLRAVELLLKHGHVIVLQAVVKRKVAIVVQDIRSWSDLINYGQLLVNADDMFNSLSLVVLHATRFKELIVASEPVKDVLVAIPCALKQRVFS